MSPAKVVPFCFESNEVRVVTRDGDPWFVARDVCRVLEIEKYRDAVSRLDDDERGSVKVDTLGGQQSMTAINESGLYTLIFRSNKPQAKPFRRWVTHEVLPSIRKSGSYDLRSMKEVSVNHTHTRATSAPGGLDIKYNLDLTKVITRPTRQGLNILSRLTGIDFTDINLGVEDEGIPGDIRRYLAERCRREAAERVALKDLYGDFRRWYRENINGRPGAVPTSRRFSQDIRYLGFSCERRGGRFYVFGLCLQEGVAR